MYWREAGMRKWLVTGDEPFLIDKFKKELIAKIETPDFNLWETTEFADTEKKFISRISLFGGQKVIILYAEHLKECEEAVRFADNSRSDTDLYVFCNSIDKRSKVYKSFAKTEIRLFNKYSAEKLNSTILQYIQRAGSKITQDAFQRYLELLNYYSEEVNLYDVQHSLERLVAFNEITQKVVESIVLDSGTGDIYSLIQLISERKYQEVFRQADLILKNQKNNVIGILSLLLRNYRLTYKMQVCSCSLEDLGVRSRTFIPRLSVEKCHEAMSILDNTINQIKRGLYLPETALRLSLAKLCQL